MQYVEKYLSNKGVKAVTCLTCIWLSFPAAVGKPDNYVLFGRVLCRLHWYAYRQNRGLDSNGDGSVTKATSAKVLQHGILTLASSNNMRPELQ